MARPQHRDPRVRALLEAHDATDAEALIRSLCCGLLAEAGASVPVDVDVLASFRNARVRVVDQEYSETIAWDGRNWLIRVSTKDTPGRQRFSCAHAVIHTYFMEAEAGASSKPSASWSAAEELLCDLGAAELLLPRDQFLARCPTRPTMDDVLDLAQEFEASAEATALRVVTLSSVPAAMVVLEPKLKPREEQELARRRIQAPLPGLADERDDPAPRLRVQKSMGNRMPFVPKHKSVDDSSLLAAVLDTGGVDGEGETGLIEGEVRFTARRLPILRGSHLVERVVAMLFDPAAEASQHRLSG